MAALRSCTPEPIGGVGPPGPLKGVKPRPEPQTGMLRHDVRMEIWRRASQLCNSLTLHCIILEHLCSLQKTTFVSLVLEFKAKDEKKLCIYSNFAEIKCCGSSINYLSTKTDFASWRRRGQTKFVFVRVRLPIVPVTWTRFDESMPPPTCSRRPPGCCSPRPCPSWRPRRRPWRRRRRRSCGAGACRAAGG